MLERFLIDENIPKTEFACDLGQCKGACCTMPGTRGAPLLDQELEEIEKAYPVVRKYLSFRHKDMIDERGFSQGRRGEYTTQVVDGKACVFATFENEIAQCAFEKAYIDHGISWRKPLSCHLFPIRVAAGVLEHLRFEYMAECRPAVERGKRENILLWQFLRTSLVRAYGEEWFEEFSAYCESKKIGDIHRFI